MGDRERRERLQRFVETAEKAKSSADGKMLETFIEDFKIAITDCPPDGNVSRAASLLRELQARQAHLLEIRNDVRVETIEAWVTACRACNGRELLVADNASITASGIGWRPLQMSVIVCRTCGDIRLRATNLENLQRTVGPDDHGFTRVFAPEAPTRGPFR